MKVLKWWKQPSCWGKFMEEGIIVKHDPLGDSDTPGDADKRIPVRTGHDLRAIEGCPWLRHGGAEGDTCLRADQSNLGREDPASDGWQYNSEGLGTSFLDWVCLQCWWTIQKEGGKFVFSKVQLHFKSPSVKPPNCLLYPSFHSGFPKQEIKAITNKVFSLNRHILMGWAQGKNH